MRVRAPRVREQFAFLGVDKGEKNVFVVFQRRERDGRKELKNRDDSEEPSSKW